MILSLRSISIWLNFLILFSLFTSYVSANPLSEREKEMLEGEVFIKTYPVAKSDLPRLVAEGLFDVPVQRVWALIYDCATYSKVMPSIKESKNLGKVNGNKVRCQLTVDLPWPMDDLTSVTDTRLIEEPKKGRYQRIWNLVSGDYTINEGSWTLESRHNGKYTYLRYEVRVEPKTSVPGFLKRAAQKSKIPGMFKKLRSQL